ncbi:MAG: hypothetical protein OER95_08765 [Acidimicrobiia bacterium]|nr:hypothetical protein [Acidimicrobiia bacterium]
MLHPLDDYPVHQTPEPILHVGTESPNAYDRYFFNGFHTGPPADGPLFLAVALGVYPNRRIMDGAFSVIVDGVQHNVRASRRLPRDRSTTVGPLTVEVVRPMGQHRIVVDGPGGHAHGIRADLTYRARSPAIEEPRFVWRDGGRIRMDYTRLTQFGSWTGWIEVDGQRIDLGPDVVGVRDRSWGTRPVGDTITTAPSPPQFFWLWTPTVFDDVCTHMALNHDADGRPWHQSGALVGLLDPDDDPLDDRRVARATEATAELELAPGTRWARSLTVNLRRWNLDGGDDVVDEIVYEPFLTFCMSGIGYRHPEWGHGHWVGEHESSRDRYDLSDIDPLSPLYVHIQALSRAHWGDRSGVGVVEQMIIGPHQPTGLTGILDPAP